MMLRKKPTECDEMREPKEVLLTFSSPFCCRQSIYTQDEYTPKMFKIPLQMFKPCLKIIADSRYILKMSIPPKMFKHASKMLKLKNKNDKRWIANN